MGFGTNFADCSTPTWSPHVVNQQTGAQVKESNEENRKSSTCLYSLAILDGSESKAQLSRAHAYGTGNNLNDQ